MPTPNTYNWPVYDLAGVWNQPEPIFEYLAGDVGMKPSVSLWYGAPGSFKTMILLDLAVCVSSKNKWLEAKPGDTTVPLEVKKNYGVLWIDQDSGESVIRARFRALAMGHKIKPTNLISWISCPMPPINLWPQNNYQNSFTFSRDTIMKEIVSRGSGMLVIDNLGAISGGADENSRDMLDVLTAIRQIADWTGVSIHLIHHANKKGDKSQYGARGHTSILQAVDYAFEVTRDDLDDIAEVRCTKSRHAPVEPFSVLFSYDNKGKSLREARFYGLGKPDKSSRISPVKKAIEAIYKHFTDGMNQSQIVALVKQHAKVGRNSAIAAISKLEQTGELDEVPTTGTKNQKVYCRGITWNV